MSLLKPVDVKSPGVEAWLLSRENAALLYEQLKARGDFREHSAPRVEIANGQSQTLARTQPRQYTRGVQLKREFPFYDLIPGQIDEGYSLQISPLMSLDGQTMEAAVDVPASIRSRSSCRWRSTCRSAGRRSGCRFRCRRW